MGGPRALRPPSRSAGLRRGLLSLFLLSPTLLLVGAGLATPTSAPHPSDLSVSISASPSQGPAPLLVEFTTTISGDTSPTQVTYNWSFGDGGPPLNVSAPNLSHTYTRPGNFTASVTAWEPGGPNSTSSILVQVTTARLSAHAGAAPVSGTAPLTVAFTGSVSGGTGTYRYFNWSFGDGGFGSGLTPTYTYEHPGSYLARFNVTDSQGSTAGSSVWVNVSAPPPPPSQGWEGVIQGWLPWIVAGVAVVLAVAAVLLARRQDWGSSEERTRRRGAGVQTAPEGPPPSGPVSPKATASPSGPPEETSGSRTVPESPPPASPPSPSAAPPSREPVAASTLGAVAPPTSIAPAPPEPTTPAPAAPSSLLEAPEAPPAAQAVPPEHEKEGEPPSSPETMATRRSGARTPSTGGVPSDTLRLSLRLVVHIASQGALGAHDIAPPGLTQAGMAEALGAKQNSIATLLKRLELAGLVVSDVRHVRGGARRMKVYRLTPRGEALARDVRSRRSASSPSLDPVVSVPGDRPSS